MSLRYSIVDLYKDFPSASVEDLQDRLEKQKEQAAEATWLPEGCCCNSYPYIMTYIEDGCLYAEFSDSEELCPACQAYYRNEHDEEMDSRLLKQGIVYLETTLESAIIAKKKKYDSMTQQQVEAEADDLSQYERYLNRSATSLSWSGDGVPSGLMDQMAETEEELEALQFEITR